MFILKQYQKILLLLLGLISFSVIIFVSTGIFHIDDAIYFTLTVLTTVGLGDLHLAESPTAIKFYGNFLMIAGALLMAILFGMITNSMVSQNLEKYFGRHRTKMKNHTILIGWNKTAEATLDELRKISKVCIVTRRQEVLKTMKYKNVDIIVGDGADDAVLMKANIKHAKHMITCSSDDSRNVMTVLLAKRLNPRIRVISAANEVVNMRILKEAGAYEVISPDVIGGRLLTSAIFEQKVVNLIKDATFVGKGTNIEEVKVVRRVTVGEVIDRFGISVMEKVTPDGKRISTLKTSDIIQPGEFLILFGYINRIKKATVFLSR